MRGAFSVGNVLAGFSVTTIVRQRKRSGYVSQPKIEGFQKRDGEPEGNLISDLSRRHALKKPQRNAGREHPLSPDSMGQVSNNDGLRLPTEFWHTTGFSFRVETRRIRAASSLVLLDTGGGKNVPRADLC